MQNNIQKKISTILFHLFFFIPILSIIGPFFPDLIISITVIFSFIIFLNTSNEKFFNNIKKFDYFILVFLLFYLFILVSSSINFFNSSDFSFENIKRYFSRSLFLFRFIFYPICIIYIAKKFQIDVNKKSLYLFILTILFVIFDTLFQYFNGKDIFGFVPMERNQLAIGRLSGPFGDELIPGSFLMRYFFLSILFIFICFQNKKQYFNYIILIFIISCLITIVLTGERAVTLLSFFGVFIFFILFKKQRLLIFSSISIFFIISLFFIFNNPILKKRIIDHSLYQFGISINNDQKDFSYKEIFNKTGKSFIDSHYGAHWETAYEIWKRNKFIGIGVKQFRYECSKEIYDNNISKLKVIRCATHPHNSYFEILSETGLIGLFLFILLFFMLLKKMLNIYKYDKDIKLPLISVILIFWPLITTGSFFTNMMQIYFSFLLTIIYMIENKFFTNVKNTN